MRISTPSKFLSFAPFLFFGNFMVAQSNLCQGALGENIFTDGDFGSGNENIVSQDPGIAPGYQYTTFPPPNDGLYTITNDMSEWESVFGVWIRPTDPSPDPKGYMMIVNASYEPGPFYTKQVDGLCENTTYQFSADILNLDRKGLGGRIFPNVSFLIDSVEEYSSGNIRNDENWNTYGFLFTTKANQTSVELTLRNNAPGGGGNDLALDNISFRACGPEALIAPENVSNICEDGDPIEIQAVLLGTEYENPAYQWQTSFDNGVNWIDITGENGSTYAHDNLISGTYIYRYVLSGTSAGLLNSKCRIYSKTKTINVVPKSYFFEESICEGLTYTVGNNSYFQTGTYVDTLISSIGCDSIVNLDLTIVDDTQIDARIEVFDVLCFGDSSGSIIVSDFNIPPPFDLVMINDYVESLPPFINLKQGQYSILITDEFGCTFNKDVSVAQPDLFEISIGEDISVLLGDEVTINTTSNEVIDLYNWGGGYVLNDNATFVPLESGILNLIAETEDGCTALDAINIFVDKTPRIYFPNIFSPNGDGLNDLYYIFGSPKSVSIVKLFTVYDRWGNAVFIKENFNLGEPSLGWDGKLNGNNSEVGVYTYLAKLQLTDMSHVVLTGSFTLVR